VAWCEDVGWRSAQGDRLKCSCVVTGVGIRSNGGGNFDALQINPQKISDLRANSAVFGRRCVAHDLIEAQR
jgi:hypothetical protein